MCLYIRDSKPRIAKRDIVVLKYLDKRGDEQFYTPVMGTPVTLGKVLKASPGKPNITFHSTDHLNREISFIREGAIHARLIVAPLDYDTNYCAKAIIPKGTKYWVSLFGTEIAAEKMLITKEEGNNDVLGDSFAREILTYAPEVNGIRIGDYQMTDNSFVHPKKSIAKTEVRGIVCGFYENGEPIICALERFREVWDKQYCSNTGEFTDNVQIMNMLPFNGREVTRKYIKKKYKDKSRFGAFEKCINYRKNKGEKWFFGALGETMAMLDNIIYLNAAHKITGLGFILSTDYLYWSCSELNSCHSWYCKLGMLDVYCNGTYKDNAYSVVPFYASSNRVSKQKTSNMLRNMLRKINRLVAIN